MDFICYILCSTYKYFFVTETHSFSTFTFYTELMNQSWCRDLLFVGQYFVHSFFSNNFVPVWCSTYIVQNLLLLLLWWGRSWWDKNQNVGLHMLLLSLHALSRSSWWEHLRLLLAYFTDVSHSPLHSLSSDTSDWWVVQEIFPAVIFSSSWDN